MAVGEQTDRVGRPRDGQRRRTRAAIVTATAELLRAGATPSIGEVAEAADVSRRTVYQYFPTLEQLLLDATLGMLDQRAVDEAIDGADPADPEARISAMIRAVHELAAEQLPLGRPLVRLSVDPAAPAEPGCPGRGYRRVVGLEGALEPLRPRLRRAGFERLVSALAVVVGWEALIVLTDVRGLGREQQLEVSLWTARA